MYSRPIIGGPSAAKSYRTMFNRTRDFFKRLQCIPILNGFMLLSKMEKPVAICKLMSHGGSLKRKHVVEVFSSPCVLRT